MSSGLNWAFRTVAVLTVVTGLNACVPAESPRSQAGKPGEALELRSNVLPPIPDLEPMAESVRAQIIGQYELIERAFQRPVPPSDDERARMLGTMGELLMAAESAAAAEPYLIRAAALEPADARWPYVLGHLHRMTGDGDRALQDFERARAIQPAAIPPLVWLGNLYLDRGESEKAASMYTQALNRQPRLFAATFGLGRAALVGGSYQKAADYFEAALAAEPAATAVHYPLALAYRQLGRTREAEAHLRARGQYEPPLPDRWMQEIANLLQSAVVYEGRGDRALASGDLPTAVASFRRAETLDPNRRAVKQKLATALALTGDIQSAVGIYQRLLDQDPGFAEAHYSLGALFLGVGRIEMAISAFAAAVTADTTYVQARLQLAHSLRKARRFDESLVTYQSALKIDPRLAEARLGYAVTLADAGRYGTSRAWLAEGRRSHPDQLEFQELLVRIMAAAPDANVRDGLAAVELATDLVERSRTWSTLEALAMALAETGRYEEAADRQREAIADYERTTGEAVASMTERLGRYEQHQPSRSPWTADPI